MRRSHTFTLQIELPLDQVYEFLADPRNFPLWAAVEPATFVHVEGMDWRGDTPFGHRLFRFQAPNAHGILDHAIIGDGEEPLITPMRVFVNDDGTELNYTFFQRPGMSEEMFTSTVTWIESDLWALKSVVEALPPRR